MQAEKWVLLVYGITAVFSIAFIVSWVWEPRRVCNGLLFNAAMLLFAVSAGLFTLITQNRILLVLVVLCGMGCLVLLVFGVYGLILFLLLNARTLLKRERRRFSNMLTLLLGLGLIVYLAILACNPHGWLPHPIARFWALAYLYPLYFLCTFTDFWSGSVLYRARPVRHNKHFLIVLGSGLANGNEVSPLLAARIERAVSFYKKQVRTGRQPPRIIFSGGKGPDEDISEAVAMKKYALACGIPECDLLLEDKSKNTRENVRFSKKIMDGIMPQGYRCALFTSDYHLFRAGVLARQEGLKCSGVAAKTAFYYRPNAMLREYIGVFMMRKKIHLIALIVLTLTAVLLLAR